VRRARPCVGPVVAASAPSPGIWRACCSRSDCMAGKARLAFASEISATNPDMTTRITRTFPVRVTSSRILPDDRRREWERRAAKGHNCRARGAGLR